MPLEKLFLILNSHFPFLNWMEHQPFIIRYHQEQLQLIVKQAKDDFEQAFEEFKGLLDFYQLSQDLSDITPYSLGDEIEQRLKAYACHLYEKMFYLYQYPEVSPWNGNQLMMMLKDFHNMLGQLSDYAITIHKNHHGIFSLGHYLSKKIWPEHLKQIKPIEVLISTSNEEYSSEPLRMALIKLLVTFYPMQILQAYDINFPKFYLIALHFQEKSAWLDEQISHLAPKIRP